MSDFNRLKNGIIGFIIGDAMGVPLEFTKRREEKVIDMLEYGSHNMPKGSWSDDSSMVIATIQSIIDNKGNINYKDIMNNFILWIEKGKFTSNNKTFGVGGTTFKALRNYYYREEFIMYKDPLMCGIDDIKDNGNGSLMRILPIAYYCYYKKLKEEEIYNLVKDVSSFTHSHEISILGCFIYVLLAIELLSGEEKENAYSNVRKYDYTKYFNLDIIKYYDRNNNSYDKCVIEAINLGNDSDTIGALVGGLSGIYYNDINNKWLNDIKRKNYLLDLCNDFYNSLL